MHNLTVRYRELKRDLDSAYDDYKAAQDTLRHVTPNTLEARNAALELLATKKLYMELSARHSVMKHHMDMAEEAAQS